MKDSDPLCCCEYFNNKNERSHMLGCCCNCEELDVCCDRLVTCNRVSCEHLSRIMSSIHDRFRIPWRGGAKQISFDSILPILVQPVLIYLAALNVWFTILIFFITSIILWYMLYVFVRKSPRTKFFFMWTAVSVFLLVLVFEVNVVPLLEILPEENVIFVIIALLSLFCIYKTWTRSKLNKVTHGDSRDDLCGNRNKATETVCSVCRKRVPPRTYHCSICQTCILCKEHHCLWLDCCVGEKNLWHFVMALFFSFCALFDGAYLTLTSVCHPVLVLEYFLVPDDCSDVYHDFEIALCFVSALYSLLASIFVLCILGQHFWLISLGFTKEDWLDLPAGERRYGGLWASRPYNKGFIRNWINFWCTRSSTISTDG